MASRPGRKTCKLSSIDYDQIIHRRQTCQVDIPEEKEVDKQRTMTERIGPAEQPRKEKGLAAQTSTNLDTSSCSSAPPLAFSPCPPPHHWH